METFESQREGRAEKKKSQINREKQMVIRQEERERRRRKRRRRKEGSFLSPAAKTNGNITSHLPTLSSQK